MPRRCGCPAPSRQGWHGRRQHPVVHLSGTMSVDAATEEQDGQIRIRHATVLRSARRLFEGSVCIPATAKG
ncbi:MAG: PrpF domain-containing protein [Paracoccaceae bacterium]